MARVLGGDGLGVGDAVLLLCFAAMLPWNVIGFWNAAIGLAILCGSRDPLATVLPASRSPARGPIRARVAIVMPVHNEAPERVLRHLQQTVASLDATGEGGRVRGLPAERYQDPAIAAAEAAQFAHWRQRAARPGRAALPAPHDNHGHKTGNLWAFLDAHGPALRSHARARRRQRHVGGGDRAAGPAHGGAARDRHPAAADRRAAQRQPVRAHLPVRHAARHAGALGRQRLVAGRLRPLLGSQCADPRGPVHGPLPACRCCPGGRRWAAGCSATTRSRRR